MHPPSPPEVRNKALPQAKVIFIFFSLSVRVWRKQIEQQNKTSGGSLGAASRRDENRDWRLGAGGAETQRCRSPNLSKAKPKTDPLSQ